MEIHSLPTVTLLIVVRNEKNYIEKSLNSLINQTYPTELTEIIIVDGMSTDGTREFLEEKVKELTEKGINIKLLDNPKKILSSGWNIGIKESKGDIVCRIDAHSEIDKNYIEIGVKELIKNKDKNVVCVGGVLKNEGVGFLGEIFAELYSSKFGVGNSAFRTGIQEPTFTDTAVYGCYWKWIFDKIGYFDETLVRNQDIALHTKILENGYKFITHPEMQIKYYVRSTFLAFIKKAFCDGYWITFSKKSYLRHKIPLFFVLYLLSIPIFFFKKSGMVFAYLSPLFLYIFLSFYFSIKDGKSHRKFFLLFLFPLFHISYGLGSLLGILTFWKRKNEN